MKVDTIVLWIVAAVAAFAALVYFAILVFGSIISGGLMLPALAIFLILAVVFAVILKQRLGNREDDYYETIEK